ncbi:MAG: hypothetical protein PHO32_05010 [Candidatus Cloacimonetes bacterium]|nr:hypothetical protein [Candidatus Cloacimonadota bacterium]
MCYLHLILLISRVNVQTHHNPNSEQSPEQIEPKVGKIETSIRKVLLQPFEENSGWSYYQSCFESTKGSKYRLVNNQTQ